MPDAYNPAPEQPLIVFFELTMGGLNKIYCGPEIPVQLFYSDEPVPSMRFTLFDVTGYEVEPAIWNSVDSNTGIAGGSFRFGYLNGGKQSQEIEFQVESYHPEFEGNSFTITLECTPLLTPMLSTNQCSGTIMECLEKICEFHNFDLKINPEFGTEYMLDVGSNDSKSTAKKEMIHMKFAQETDLAFIEELLKYARDAEGKGGYRCAITSGNGGKPTLDITKAKNVSSHYTYEVQAKDSVVVSWRPEVNFSGAVFGANDVQENSYQNITGNEQKFVCQQQVTKDFQETFGESNSTTVKSVPTKEKADKMVYTGGSENFPESVTGSAIRKRPGTSCSPFGGVNPLLNDHLCEWMDSQNATLTILGDPEVNMMQPDGSMTLVEVKCYWPIGPKNKHDGKSLHYTSGLYQCDKVEHTIAAGTYLTTLYLSRAAGGLPEEPKE